VSEETVQIWAGKPGWREGRVVRGEYHGLLHVPMRNLKKAGAKIVVQARANLRKAGWVDEMSVTIEVQILSVNPSGNGGGQARNQL
jgi:hypothetical protein